MNEYEDSQDVEQWLRAQAQGSVPKPSDALLSFLADPSAQLITTDSADLAGQDADRPADLQPAGSNRRRSMHDLLSTARASLAGMSKVGKVALAAGVIVAAGVGTASAATLVTSSDDPPVVDQGQGDQGDSTGAQVADDQSDNNNQGDSTDGTASTGGQVADNQGDNNNNQGDSTDGTASTGGQVADDQGDNNDQGDSTDSADDQGDNNDNQGDSVDSQSGDGQGDSTDQSTDDQGDGGSSADDSSDNNQD